MDLTILFYLKISLFLRILNSINYVFNITTELNNYK